MEMYSVTCSEAGGDCFPLERSPFTIVMAYLVRALTRNMRAGGNTSLRYST